MQSHMNIVNYFSFDFASYDDMISGNFDSEKVDQNYVFYYIYFLISSIHAVE
jgi:hypothetical protein